MAGWILMIISKVTQFYNLFLFKEKSCVLATAILEVVSDKWKLKFRRKNKALVILIHKVTLRWWAETKTEWNVHSLLFRSGHCEMYPCGITRISTSCITPCTQTHTHKPMNISQNAAWDTCAIFTDPPPKKSFVCAYDCVFGRLHGSSTGNLNLIAEKEWEERKKEETASNISRVNANRKFSKPIDVSCHCSPKKRKHAKCCVVRLAIADIVLLLESHTHTITHTHTQKACRHGNLNLLHYWSMRACMRWVRAPLCVCLCVLPQKWMAVQLRRNCFLNCLATPICFP